MLCACIWQKYKRLSVQSNRGIVKRLQRESSTCIEWSCTVREHTMHAQPTEFYVCFSYLVLAICLHCTHLIIANFFQPFSILWPCWLLFFFSLFNRLFSLTLCLVAIFISCSFLVQQKNRLGLPLFYPCRIFKPNNRKKKPDCNEFNANKCSTSIGSETECAVEQDTISCVCMCNSFFLHLFLFIRYKIRIMYKCFVCDSKEKKEHSTWAKSRLQNLKKPFTYFQHLCSWLGDSR